MRLAAGGLVQREQIRFDPMFLVMALLSALAALVGVAMALAGEGSTQPLSVFVGLHAALLLPFSALIAGSHAAECARWRRRLAPSAAVQRVQRACLLVLACLAAYAVAGPLLMMAGLAWVQPVRVIAGQALLTFAALVAALLAGAALGWFGQSSASSGIRAVQAALKRRLGVWRGWQRLRNADQSQADRRAGTWWIWFVLLPQALSQAEHWRFHAWGKVLNASWDPVWAGGWMAMLGVLANAFLIAPQLQWRLRLAPGGMSPAAWARRAVRGSILYVVTWATVMLGASMAVSNADLRAVQLTAWAPACADAVLAVTWVLWMRGLRNTSQCEVSAGLVLGAATMLLVAAGNATGWSLQRGLGTLVVELVAAAAFAVAAQRAWARQDLNRLATLG